MKPTKNFLLFGTLLLLAGIAIIIGANTMGSAGIPGHGANPTGIMIGIIVAAVGGVLLIIGIARKLGNSDRQMMHDEARRQKELDAEHGKEPGAGNN